VSRRPLASWALILERSIPWLLGITAFIVAHQWTALRLFGASWRDQFLTNAITACSVFVAYLVTAATIIPAVEEKSIVKKLRDWGYFQNIVRYFKAAIWASSFFLLLSLAAFPLTDFGSHHEQFNRYFSALWWAAGALSIGAAVRMIRILLKLLIAR
jgi:hypothetical protein